MTFPLPLYATVRVVAIREDRFADDKVFYRRHPRVGDVGTVVETFTSPDLACEVECCDPDSGEATWLDALYPDEVEAVDGVGALERGGAAGDNEATTRPTAAAMNKRLWLAALASLAAPARAAPLAPADARAIAQPLDERGVPAITQHGDEKIIGRAKEPTLAWRALADLPRDFAMPARATQAP